MKKIIEKVLLSVAFLMGTSFLHAQSSNKVWFVTWNGQPNPSSDVGVQSLVTAGDAATHASGAAVNFVSQVNLPAFNSPYDIAVDSTKGKVYVLDNNAQGEVPEYIYSFDLTGTPAQITASKQIIYTMPVPAADVNASLYPFVSGLALDPVKHCLYFNQIDVITGTNSYIGCLNLAGSGNPVLQTLYVGQVPGQGTIAVDATNIYLGAINGINGNNGVYTAPVSGSGTFSEIVTLSSGNTTFANGFVSGVASAVQSNLVYYLTFNAGYVNHNYNLGQNAVWTYNTVTHVSTKIASGYPGAPNNIAIDPANNRYYFTIGRDSTGNASPTNYQAIYTGTVGSASAPTLFYTPLLNGQDAAAQANAGNVSLQGIYIQDLPSNNQPPVAGADAVSAQENLPINLPMADLLANDSDPDTNQLSITAVSSPSTNGGSVSLSGNFIVYTPATNYVGPDQFNYTLSDGQGGQAQGKVTVNVLSVNLPASNQVVFTLAPAGGFLLFAGGINQSYVIQYASSLSGPWYDLSPSLTVGVTGFIGYNDLTRSPSAMKFYRVRSRPN